MRPAIRSPRLLAARTLLAAGLALAAAAASAVTSSTVRVDGLVTTPKTYTFSDLQALPSTTQSVSFLSGGGAQTHTYTGTSLWGVVNASGIQTDPAVRNDILRKYVLATATDGYQVVFSGGELNPGFGNRPDFLAYAETIGGVSGPLGSDGMARIAVPGDVRGGRYVSNVVSLTVGTSASKQTGTGGGKSDHFTVSGEVVHPGASFALADLEAFTPVTQTVSFLSGNTSQTRTYTGVNLWDLLNAPSVGILADAAVKNDILRKYVVATGSDGYQAIISLGEINPSFGNQPYFIAYEETIGGVSQALGNDGFARLAVPGDVRGGRYVSNLVSLEVFTATAPVPEPETWALLVAGLGFVAWRGARRRR